MSFAASSANISRRFYLVGRPTSWWDARAFCRGRFTDLAWVRSQEENQALQDLVKNGTVWIGLGKQSWRWSDGSEATFLPWKTSALPSGDCGALDVRSQPPGIALTNCAGNASFFCSRGTGLRRLSGYDVYKHLFMSKMRFSPRSTEATMGEPEADGRRLVCTGPGGVRVAPESGGQLFHACQCSGIEALPQHSLDFRLPVRPCGVLKPTGKGVNAPLSSRRR